MTGKFAVTFTVLTALIVGVSIYYLQVYAYYEEVRPEDVTLVSRTSLEPEAIPTDAFQGIDADSSPIRYRACFETDLSLEQLTETYVQLDQVAPRNAPNWFDCFDAKAIAAELDAGTALLFLGEKNVKFGVDRIVAITGNGRGYVWHDLNDCGEKAYDGTIVGEECPKRDTE